MRSLREDDEVTIPILVREIRTGKRGRPRKDINIDFLRNAVAKQRGLTYTDLADLLGVSRVHLYKVLKQNGLGRVYSDITDAQLDEMMRAYKTERPDSGIRYGISYLRRKNIRVQRRRITESLKRVDRLGTRLREHKAIKRRRYKTKRPNTMWHVDGHHKLIRWGFVIHGFIDGYCRSVSR